MSNWLLGSNAVVVVVVVVSVVVVVVVAVVVQKLTRLIHINALLMRKKDFAASL